MKRLLRRASEQWYHLTNDPNFTYDPNFQNKYQQMGPGLYITPAKDLDNWSRSLGGREYAVPFDISGLNIVDESSMPSYFDMQRELAKAGFKVADIEANEPQGNILSDSTHARFDIAQKITWALWKGYNAIKLADTSDGEQIRVLDNAPMNFGQPMDIYDAVKKSRA